MSIRQKYVQQIHSAVGSDEAEVRGYVENLRDDEVRKALKHILKTCPGRLFSKLGALDETGEASADES